MRVYKGDARGVRVMSAAVSDSFDVISQYPRICRRVMYLPAR